MKNLLYAIIAMCMLYVGLQQITWTGSDMQVVFVMSWLCLAIFVIGGNFAHYLYGPKKRNHRTHAHTEMKKRPIKQKTYLRQ
ncbi:hypothetical protein [Metabacillus malikii]|uniref:Peptidoglycan biosynthesis protein MviN/MurJ (Putative lipid II flippase) n=1 Tax=Metabacillus malikii TaxID=1504265 RepID=A0ABT9ZHK7_9BACI|nr:hypothetical protein [Metabacillus malikii]MDQ0231033.1 peptidoglycan biosynthesis protein MviN/MurJ (putative lipid II flippase) [Metabacillus malikii]